MYDNYYNHLKVKYGYNCNLLYTDTDSLLLEIKTKDVYADMACVVVVKLASTPMMDTHDTEFVN